MTVLFILYGNGFQKPKPDCYHVLLKKPKFAHFHYGQKLNEKGHLVIPVSPKIQISALINKIKLAFKTFKCNRVRLELVEASGNIELLDHAKTLQQQHIRIASGSLIQVVECSPSSSSSDYSSSDDE